MLIFLSLAGFALVSGALMLLWANFHAVEGYEDENGFHPGRR